MQTLLTNLTRRLPLPFSASLPVELNHLILYSPNYFQYQSPSYTRSRLRPLSTPAEPPTFSPSELFEPPSQEEYDLVPSSTLDAKDTRWREMSSAPKTNEESLLSLIRQGDHAGVEELRKDLQDQQGVLLENRIEFGEYALWLLENGKAENDKWLAWFSLHPPLPPPWISRLSEPSYQEKRKLRSLRMTVASIIDALPPSSDDEGVVTFANIAIEKGYYDILASNYLPSLALYNPRRAEQLSKVVETKLLQEVEGHRSLVAEGQGEETLIATRNVQQRLRHYRDELIKVYLVNSRAFVHAGKALMRSPPGSSTTSNISFRPSLPIYLLALHHFSKYSRERDFMRVWRWMEDNGLHLVRTFDVAATRDATSKPVKGRFGAKRREVVKTNVGHYLSVVTSKKLAIANQESERRTRVKVVEGSRAYTLLRSSRRYQVGTKGEEEEKDYFSDTDFLDSLATSDADDLSEISKHFLRHFNPAAATSESKPITFLPRPSTTLKFLKRVSAEREDVVQHLTTLLLGKSSGVGAARSGDKKLRNYWACLLMRWEGGGFSNANGEQTEEEVGERVRRTFGEHFQVDLLPKEVRDVLQLSSPSTTADGRKEREKLIPSSTSLHLLLRFSLPLLVSCTSAEFSAFYTSLLTSYSYQNPSDSKAEARKSRPLIPAFTRFTPSQETSLDSVIFSTVLQALLHRARSEECIEEMVEVLSAMRSLGLPIKKDQVGMVVSAVARWGDLQDLQVLLRKTQTLEERESDKDYRRRRNSPLVSQFLQLLQPAPNLDANGISTSSLPLDRIEFDIIGYTSILSALRQRGEHSMAQNVLNQLMRRMEDRKEGEAELQLDQMFTDEASRVEEAAEKVGGVRSRRVV